MGGGGGWGHLKGMRAGMGRRRRWRRHNIFSFKTYYSSMENCHIIGLNWPLQEGGNKKSNILIFANDSMLLINYNADFHKGKGHRN